MKSKVYMYNITTNCRSMSSNPW